MGTPINQRKIHPILPLWRVGVCLSIMPGNRVRDGVCAHSLSIRGPGGGLKRGLVLWEAAPSHHFRRHGFTVGDARSFSKGLAGRGEEIFLIQSRPCTGAWWSGGGETDAFEGSATLDLDASTFKEIEKCRDGLSLIPGAGRNRADQVAQGKFTLIDLAVGIFHDSGLQILRGLEGSWMCLCPNRRAVPGVLMP